MNFMPSEVAAIEKPENGVTATLQFRPAVAESAQVTLKVATGDGLFLRQDRNLSDVEDRDESVENLGLKPTVDKAKIPFSVMATT